MGFPDKPKGPCHLGIWCRPRAQCHMRTLGTKRILYSYMDPPGRIIWIVLRHPHIVRGPATRAGIRTMIMGSCTTTPPPRPRLTHPPRSKPPPKTTYARTQPDFRSILGRRSKGKGSGALMDVMHLDTDLVILSICPGFRV